MKASAVITGPLQKHCYRSVLGYVKAKGCATDVIAGATCSASARMYPQSWLNFARSLGIQYPNTEDTHARVVERSLEQALEGVTLRLCLCNLLCRLLHDQLALSLKVLQHLLQAGLQGSYLLLALLLFSCLHDIISATSLASEVH